MGFFNKIRSFFRKKSSLTPPLKEAISEYKHVAELYFGKDKAQNLVTRLSVIAHISIYEKKSGEVLSLIGAETAKFRKLNRKGLNTSYRKIRELQEATGKLFGKDSDIYKRVTRQVEAISISNSDYESCLLFEGILEEVERAVNKK